MEPQRIRAFRITYHYQALRKDQRETYERAQAEELAKRNQTTNQTAASNITEKTANKTEIEAELEQNNTLKDFHMTQHLDVEGMKKKVSRHEHNLPQSSEESADHANDELLRHDGAQHIGEIAEATNTSSDSSHSDQAPEAADSHLSDFNKLSENSTQPIDSSNKKLRGVAQNMQGDTTPDADNDELLRHDGEQFVDVKDEEAKVEKSK